MMEDPVPVFKCFCPELSHLGKATRLTMSDDKGQRYTVIPNAWQEKNQE